MRIFFSSIKFFSVLLLSSMISCGVLNSGDEMVENPKPDIKGVDLLGGKKKITIPFEEEQGFIIVRLRMQKTFPMKFIFDTGAEHTIIFNKMYSDLLNMSYEKQIPILGSDMSEAMFANISRNVLMETNSTETVKRDVLVLERDYLRLFETLGIIVDGILGGAFFRGLVLEIDYKKNKLHLYHPDYFEAPTDKKYQKYPLEIKNFKPYLDASVVSEGDTATLKFLIDTGASLTFLAHTNSHPSLHLPDQVIPGRIGSGLGGELMGYMGILDEIEIGDLSFDNIVVSYQDLNASIVEKKDYFRNGLIGNVVLSRFHIFIDYNREILYAKPTEKYNKKFDYDKSGLTVFAYGPKLNNFYVKSVLKGSPGEEAGIKEGDKILKLGRKKHTSLTLGKIYHEFKKEEGKKIKLTLVRGDDLIKVEFLLKDLFRNKLEKS